MMAHVRPRLLLVATQLLTRLPVGDPWRHAGDVAASVRWFGAVGTLVGGVGASVYWLASLALPPLAAATVAATSTILLTGALHEDGLADTADGLFGGSAPDARLRIMRDSAVGAYGTLALLLVVVLRVGLLAGLAPVQGAAALVVAGATGRGVLGLALLGAVPAAGDGTGADLVERLRPMPAAAAGVTAALVGLGLLGPVGLLLVAAGGAAAAVVRGVAHRRLGGVTGDVMGAMVLLADLAALGVATGVDAGAALR
jgi:adenosylcobinamide-GDP ribazoletransferase